jgi:hypothetical protein
MVREGRLVTVVPGDRVAAVRAMCVHLLGAQVAVIGEVVG